MWCEALATTENVRGSTENQEIVHARFPVLLQILRSSDYRLKKLFGPVFPTGYIASRSFRAMRYRCTVQLSKANMYCLNLPSAVIVSRRDRRRNKYR